MKIKKRKKKMEKDNEKICLEIKRRKERMIKKKLIL